MSGVRQQYVARDEDGKRLAVPVRASSGVVEYCCGETAAELFQRADQAMYAAKAQRASQRLE